MTDLISYYNNCINNPDTFLGRCVINGIKKQDETLIDGTAAVSKKALQANGSWHDYLMFNRIFDNINQGLANTAKKVSMIYGY